MRPGENAFSLGSSFFSAIFVFSNAGIFRIWQTFPAMHIQKKKTGNTEAAVQPVFIVCAARAGYVCSEDQQAGPLAASVGCKRKSCRQRIFLFHLHWSKRAAEKRRRNAGVLLEGCGEVAAVVEAETLCDLRDGQG